MNKADLIKKMSNDADITQTQATKAFNSIIEGVAKELSKNRRVTIVGFGTFSVSHRQPQDRRAPEDRCPQGPEVHAGQGAERSLLVHPRTEKNGVRHKCLTFFLVCRTAPRRGFLLIAE